ncbi:MAG: hypothetical protein methR_P1571 [Methyloprofundus sp.]|nr:MAG: hypothetical protein methR_P1571 [Methyloprofundus sp.]
MMDSLLVFGYGNLSRGDDALGPLLVEYIEQNIQLEGVEVMTDFQLQIEHALDLDSRQLVLFIDASIACESAYALSQLSPAKDKSYTTHAMSPAAVLSVYQNIMHKEPPPCFLLSVQAFEFELGADLSERSAENLKLAIGFINKLFNKPELLAWQALSAG